MRLLPPHRFLVALLLLAPAAGDAQGPTGFQTDFSAEEFSARRARIYDSIGTRGGVSLSKHTAFSCYRPQSP